MFADLVLNFWVLYGGYLPFYLPVGEDSFFERERGAKNLVF